MLRNKNRLNIVVENIKLLYWFCRCGYFFGLGGWLILFYFFVFMVFFVMRERRFMEFVRLGVLIFFFFF